MRSQKIVLANLSPLVTRSVDKAALTQANLQQKHFQKCPNSDSWLSSAANTNKIVTSLRVLCSAAVAGIFESVFASKFANVNKPLQ
jgi:hypothetical protein